MDLIKIGYTKKSYGVHGEVKFFVDNLFENDLLDATFIFLDIHGDKVPFFVEHINTNRNLLVKFASINNPEEALLVSGKDAYLEAALIPEETIKKQELQEQIQSILVGYAVIDLNLGKIGVVEEIEEYPRQQMLRVKGEGLKSAIFLIPLVEAFLMEINDEEGFIKVDLPEGLVPDR